MPAHVDKTLAADTWTLVAELASGDTVAISNPLPEPIMVRVTATGAGVPTTDVGDFIEPRACIVYDDAGDIYVRASEATTIATRPNIA